MAKCKTCKQEIEWLPYQKRDGSTGYRPIDPGKDSHDCPGHPEVTEPIEPSAPEADKTASDYNEPDKKPLGIKWEPNTFSPGKIRILKVNKIQINFETNDLLLTVEEFE